MYKQTIYKQGDTWDDGCDYVCRCEDESKGIYRCTTKCPLLPPLPKYCSKINLPGQCCPAVSCRIPGFPGGQYSPVPGLTPELTPNTTTLVIGQSGFLGGKNSLPGNGTLVPSNAMVTGQLRDKCVRNNKMYNQGDSWTEGCQYNCSCLDARSGYFECVPLCPTFENLPAQCQLEPARPGSCCKQPKCTANGKPVSPDFYPLVGSTAGGITGFRPGFLPTSSSKYCLSCKCGVKR